MKVCGTMSNFREMNKEKQMNIRKQCKSGNRVRKTKIRSVLINGD